MQRVAGFDVVDVHGRVLTSVDHAETATRLVRELDDAAMARRSADGVVIAVRATYARRQGAA